MLPLQPFRNSLYISLALAIMCVGAAGFDLLPEFPILTGFSLLLLGVAYYMEGRFELNLRDANLVGLFLSVMLGLWGVFQFVRPPTGLIDALPWPASALPYLAPVIMVLIPAKLFRPKHMGDYWTMHGLGLVSVSLACAMASDGVFVILFICYGISFVWGLAMFQIYREVGSELSGRVSVVRSRGREIKPAIIRAAVVGLLAVPLFWMTPRSNQQWQLGFNSRGKTTGLGDGGVDVNSSGSIEVNRERVFEVYAEDRKGEPIAELPGELRFRVAHLQLYGQGRWQRDTNVRVRLAERTKTPLGYFENPHDRMTDFGPNTIYLKYVTGAKLGRNQPLADPVAWKPGEYGPVIAKPSPNAPLQNWSQRPDGTFDGLHVSKEYLQSWVMPTDFEHTAPVWALGPPIGLSQAPAGLWRLKEFSENLLKRLVNSGKLPPQVLTDRDPVTNGPEARYHEVVSKAICDYFAHSGEYTYTLDLVRVDKTIDPVEDFIVNVKSGHCQRFASALAMTLRTLGIPTQLILGYRGLESRGDGWYDVREDHAHAWVEVLIPSDDPNLPFPKELEAGLQNRDLHQYRWLIVDPTPSGVEETVKETPPFWERAKEQWEATLKTLLLAYNADSRERTAQAVQQWFFVDLGWLWLVGGAATLFFGQRIRVRWRIRKEFIKKRSVLPTYMRQLEDLLVQHQLSRPEENTWQEWAVSLGDKLRGNAQTLALAEIPAKLVQAYYLERFGMQSSTDEHRLELEKDVQELEKALARPS